MSGVLGWLPEHEYKYHNAPPYPETPPPVDTNNALLEGFGLSPYSSASIDQLERSSILSAEQLAAANLLLDFSDHRSQAAKLKSLGVPTTKYNNWLKFPPFQAYLRKRAEYLLNNTVHEAHVALLQNIQRGNQRSLEFYYEMTGRFTRANQQESALLSNVTMLLVKLIEVIQLHVSDPRTLELISADFQRVLNSASPVDPPNQGAIGSSEVLVQSKEKSDGVGN